MTRTLACKAKPKPGEPGNLDRSARVIGVNSWAGEKTAVGVVRILTLASVELRMLENLTDTRCLTGRGP